MLDKAQKQLPKQTRERMERIIRDALAFSGTRETALVAMLMPGHGIPLTHTCGAVLDHDMVRLTCFAMGWGVLAGQIASEDCPDSPIKVRLPLGDIVWISPEIKEVR